MSSDQERRHRESEAAERRRRRERVFGDVLPDSTSDDRDPSDAGSVTASGPASESRRGSSSDEWLKANVPPHHG